MLAAASLPPIQPPGPENLLQILLDDSQTGIAQLCPVYAAGEPAELLDFKYVRLNPAAQRLLGLPEQPAETLRTLAPQADGVFAFYKQAFLAGTPGSADLRVPDAAGQPGELRVVAQRTGQCLMASFTPAPAGQVPTQQVKAPAIEAQAAERETLYQLFEHMPAGVALLRGPKHRFVYANCSFERLFPGRPLLGLLLAEVVPETVTPGLAAQLDRVYQTGESYLTNEVPLVISQPPGQPPQRLYVNFLYQAYREHGQTSGVSVVAYDVTEQVLARREQESTQGMLRTVFEQAPVALALLQGPAYVVAVANPAVCELWGRDPAQVPGRPLFDLLPEVANQGLREILDEVRRTGTPFVAYESPMELLRWGRPEVMYCNFVLQPLADAWGEFSSVVVVATDVTPTVLARRQTDQALDDLRRTNEQLTRTNADLDTFIYTASHDLKSPIANIEGLLLLLRQQLPAEARQAGMVPRVLEMMQGAVERFQLTIAQLTDLAKLQQAYTQPAEEIYLPAIVEAVRLDLAPLLTEARAQLLVNLDSCATVSFAPQHLRSIIYNLLSNAVKYRHPDRPLVVQLSCRRTPTAAELNVRDNGLGLNPEQQSKLFGMFRRLHDHVPGSGVGLYMVKRIVENAGGSIHVQSQAGVGSTFTVSFPI